MRDNMNDLARLEKPGRYTGGELNCIIKNQAQVSFALAFPDVYEVGMSYLGFKILYHILNKLPFVQAERVYAPWRDMEEMLRRAGQRLVSLECKRPLNEFDLVGFTLQYELTYSNILNMLDLGGIEIWAAERGPDAPFVVGGGPCVYNPEPLAGFFDFFIIGEGEELVAEVADACRLWKAAGRPGGRRGFLTRVAALPGIYVPGFYQDGYAADGHFAGLIKTEPSAPGRINKRVIADLDKAGYPVAPVVPFIEIVHDRIILELFRGCTRGCRFCQAGMIYRPVRERSREQLRALARRAIDSTGYDEISLMSLSTADYSCLPGLLDDLLAHTAERVSVSLPSLRIDSFSVDLANKVRQVRKSGLTFAPEAGTQRLRDVINKGVTQDDLLTAAAAAFNSGWTLVKLYFMIGLPTERQEDLEGIVRLAEQVLAVGRSVRKDVRVTVSVSSFVPKPWTPFQWAGQDAPDTLREKQRYLKSLIKSRAIVYQYHDPAASALEGLFARGGRRLGKILFAAWRQGARFDGWSDCFNPDIWQAALAQDGSAAADFSGREEKFPWEHICPGVTKEYLWSEWEKATRGELTADCRAGCTGCGVCPALGVNVMEAAR